MFYTLHKGTDMKIKQYKHVYETEERMCWALIKDDNTFVDSFDYDIANNKVRFYGSEKHYELDKIPKKKYKLWKTNDFHNIMFFQKEL